MWDGVGGHVTCIVAEATSRRFFLAFPVDPSSREWLKQPNLLTKIGGKDNLLYCLHETTRITKHVSLLILFSSPSLGFVKIDSGNRQCHFM